MNVFLITAPFQVLNAVEAIHHFNFENNKLIILLIGLFNKSQYEGIIDKHHWQTVKYVTFYNCITKRSINYDFGAVRPINIYERTLELYLTFYQFIKRRRIDRLAESVGLVDNLILGSYRSDYDLHFRHFANRVNCKDIYVIDVGTNTLDFQRKSDDLNKSTKSDEFDGKNTFNRFKKRIRKNFIDWDDIGKKRVKFFTCYDCDESEQDQVIKNNYKYLKSSMQSCSISDDVMFLGESSVDDGLLSFDVYLEYLSRIKTYFGESDLVYVPHPRESEKYVQIIRESLRFKIERFNVPIEYALLAGGRRPRCLASFFSSALQNCSVIFGESLIIKSFRLREDHLLKGKDMVDRIYSHFASKKSGNIEVIFDY
jgi:hypothetical protein